MPPFRDRLLQIGRGLVADAPDLAASPALQAGRKANYSGLGTGSLLLDLPAGLAVDKAVGRKGAYHEGAWDHFSRPLMNLDERAGAAAKRVLPGFMKRLVEGSEEIPLPGVTMEGLPVKVTRPVARLSEPLMKTRRIAVPLGASAAFFNWREQKQEEQEARELIDQLLAEQQLEVTAMQTTGHEKTAHEILEDRALESAGLLKRASERIRALDGDRTALLEKNAGYELRAQAQKLAWEMVERGHVDPYADASEFDAKVAGILEHGVDKVASALDLNIAVDRLSLGETKVASGGDVDPLSAFVYGID